MNSCVMRTQIESSDIEWSADMQRKRGVALTGRNTIGPPSRAAPGELRCICATMECYRRRQTTTTDASEQINTGPL